MYTILYKLKVASIPVTNEAFFQFANVHLADAIIWYKKSNKYDNLFYNSWYLVEHLFAPRCFLLKKKKDIY